MKVAPLEEQALRYVLRKLADISRRELYATLTDDFPLSDLVERIVSSKDGLYGAFTLACEDGTPAAIVALLPLGGGRAGIFWIRTDRFAEIGLSVCRWVHKFYIPEFLMQFRRVDFTGVAPDTPSGRWLRSFGFECEGIARAYSFRGEDFGYWAWLHPEWQSAHAAKRRSTLGTVDGPRTGL